MVILTQSAIASDKLTFTKEVVANMAGELQVCKADTAYNDKMIQVLNLELDKYLTLSTEYKSKIDLLVQDKADLRLRGDKLEKVYTTCTSDLNECKQEKPSRVLWFGVGFVSAIVLGVVGAFAIRK